MTTAAEEHVAMMIKLERINEKKKEIAASYERWREREVKKRLQQWKEEAPREEEEVAAMIEKLDKWKRKPDPEALLELYSDNGLVNGEIRSEKFEVDEVCALESNEIYSLISTGSRKRCTNIESKILEEVLSFCVRRASAKMMGQDIEASDSAYLYKLSFTPWPVLIKILRAACELKVIRLMDLASTAILNLVGKKGTSEILKMFNFTQSISLEEIKRAKMKLHSRAFRMHGIGPSSCS